MRALSRVVFRRVAHPQRDDPFRWQQLSLAFLTLAGALALELFATGERLAALTVLVLSVVASVSSRRWWILLAGRLRTIQALENRVFSLVGQRRGGRLFHWKQRGLADIPTLLVFGGAVAAVGLGYGGADSGTITAAASMGALLGLTVGESAWFVMVRCSRVNLEWTGSHDCP